MEDANEARQSVSDLNKYVDGAFSDGIISGAEAKAIEKYLNTVSQSRKEMDATYTSLYVNPFLSGRTKERLVRREKQSQHRHHQPDRSDPVRHLGR